MKSLLHLWSIKIDFDFVVNARVVARLYTRR
jgi:hypothetical protein